MTTPDIAQAWDENADTWARHVRAGYDVFRELYNNPAFFSFIGDISGLDVLDAGCGEGYNTRLFAQRGAQVSGCDLSPKLIALAREEEARQPLGIRYETASMGALASFADASFDAVLSTMALMDCDCYADAITEFRRVLRPSGMLAFNILHPCFSHRNVLGWERNEQGNVTGIRLGDYFQVGLYTESWSFAAATHTERPFTIVYNNLTLTDILNPICAAGFRLDAIHEPIPSLEASQQEPRLAKHRLIPQTLLVKAISSR